MGDLTLQAHPMLRATAFLPGVGRDYRLRFGVSIEWAGRVFLRFWLIWLMAPGNTNGACQVT